jgi:squalene synthase HpnC
MPIDHYENFPVASVLLPRHLQGPVSQVYWFARSADDLADEGDASAESRIASLKAYDAQLVCIDQDRPLDHGCEPARFERLAELIRTWPLSTRHFHDLLSAFMQDVVVTRYLSYEQLLDYCNRSANPVGRLMLELYRQSSPENTVRADAICTSLQLINFWQDVEVDARKGRIYLPLEDLQRFGVDPDLMLAGKPGPGWRELMRFECQRARQLMLSGAPVVHQLPGRIGLELRLVVQGGLRILKRIEQVDFDVFTRRPVLSRSDYLAMMLRAVVMRPSST